MAEEMFKTTLMGGFDKDDVQEKVQKMKDETAQQQLAFKKEIEEKEQKIAELQKRLELKEANQERLEDGCRCRSGSKAENCRCRAGN